MANHRALKIRAKVRGPEQKGSQSKSLLWVEEWEKMRKFRIAGSP